jgi:ABC-type lipoprotein export system ATPase subunit
MGVPVVVEAVQKTYPGPERITALSGVSLDVRRGEMVALMGPSGCGKSTLLGLIGAQDRPSAGKILLDGVSTSDLNEAAMAKLRRERVGMVFQSFNLLDSLSVLDNVALPLILQGREEGEFADAALAMLEAVCMASRARARPSELSGGQQQRVAIARALVHAPAVLLADEATGNLDSETAESSLALLREVADAGQAILIATHSAEVAERCDRVLRMRDGKILVT